MDTTKFNIRNVANLDSVKWDFDDGSISKKLKPVHYFSSPGNYQVKLQKFFNGLEFESISEVTINKLPDVEINAGPDTVLVFTGSTVKLEIDNGYLSQQWNNGSTEYFIEVTEPGYYWVEAYNFNCCSKIDSVLVKEIRIFIPTAFIPGGTGEDATYNVVDMDNAIEEMNMIIYDRWGNQVKELKNKYEQWDGGGQQSGVYFYTIKAKMVDGTNFTKNGNITLLR